MLHGHTRGKSQKRHHCWEFINSSSSRRLRMIVVYGKSCRSSVPSVYTREDSGILGKTRGSGTSGKYHRSPSSGISLHCRDTTQELVTMLVYMFKYSLWIRNSRSLLNQNKNKRTLSCQLLLVLRGDGISSSTLCMITYFAVSPVNIAFDLSSRDNRIGAPGEDCC